MTRSPEHLRRDALRIWHAGLEAVRSERLVHHALRVEGSTLWIGQEALDLDGIERIAVVGAGKAGAGMAAAVEAILGPRRMDQKRLAGWVNVPEDCLRPLARIHLHGARPPGVNEPTRAGVEGSESILRLVRSLGPADLCLCLISGGGSALLPAPVEGITLDDKLALTRHLSAAGANIQQLNAVRKQLSRIKGGGLARACRAGRLVALIISDVLGDPLDVIASGPTVEDSSTPEQALEILDQFRARQAGIADRVFEHLAEAGKARGGDRRRALADKQPVPPGALADKQPVPPGALADKQPVPPGPLAGEQPVPARVTNLVIGNNATAVDAAGREAERLGYCPALESALQSEGAAEPLGEHLAEMAMRMRDHPGPDCLVSGGEPVVRLVEASRRGLGGRNQQLVLAALARLAHDGAQGLVLLSGGTDGEDGPTDAAGAWVDASIVAGARQRGLDPADFLARNDAYHFFGPLGGLIHTGPTHTNVGDLRVVVVSRRPGQIAK